MVFVIVLPLLQTYLFNTAIGRKPKNLQIGVINNEMSVDDCSYAAYRGCFLDENETISLSCLYLEFLQNETYHLVSITNTVIITGYVGGREGVGLLFKKLEGRVKEKTLQEFCKNWFKLKIF